MEQASDAGSRAGQKAGRKAGLGGDPRQAPAGDAAAEVSSWRARGQSLQVFGHQVFALRAPSSDTTEDRAPWLVLHGFPTSSFDFRAALPRLARRRAVIVHDHLGFGLSDKPERYSYSLLEQAEVALQVWRSMGITRGHLLAHDYGTSVATELCARRERGGLPIELASLTLCNGSVHRELARVTTVQKLLQSPLGPVVARLSNEKFFRRQMRRIVARREPFERELDAMWLLVERADGLRRAPVISQYLAERVRFRERWIGALTRLDVPTHVLWGRLDPIAVPAIPELLSREIPGARLTWLDDLGHYPMVEDPERWADRAASFVDALDAPEASRPAERT